jgi:hypothetical protein
MDELPNPNFVKIFTLIEEFKSEKHLANFALSDD